MYLLEFITSNHTFQTVRLKTNKQKVLNNTMYTNKLHEISKSYLMQAGKLVEKSLHRHQSHFSNESPAAGRGRH